MRCCKFYTPSESDQMRHDGLRESEDYDFNRPLRMAACSNPEIIGNTAMFGPCNFASDMSQCMKYTPEDPRLLKASQVTMDDRTVELRLETARADYGIVEYYISSVEGGERTVQHTISAHRHGAESATMSLKLFDQELERFGDDKTVEELPTRASDEDSSYILEVQNAVYSA